MYNHYISFVNKYFFNTVSVVESFHIIKLINDKINNYCNKILYEFKKRDETEHKQLEAEKGREQLDKVTEKWNSKYPNSMKSWHNNWDVLSPIFKFSAEVRKIIYTTNAIESLNSTYKKLNRQRTVFSPFSFAVNLPPLSKIAMSSFLAV
ncbi:transposase [Eubacteriales bacterium KG127]